MYAIRSYYESSSISSEDHIIEVPGFHAQRFPGEKGTPGIGSTVTGQIKKSFVNNSNGIGHALFVITSYSIHYTKLYECSKLLDVEERVLYTEVNKIRQKREEQAWNRSQPVPAQTVVPEQPVVPAYINEVFSESDERNLIAFLLRFGNKNIRLNDQHHSEIGA